MHSFVKIGISSDVYKRINQLQSGSPYHIDLIRLVPNGSIELEARFHAFYKNQHISLEWFKFSDDMLEVEPKDLPPFDPNFSLFRRRVAYRRPKTPILLGENKPTIISRIKARSRNSEIDKQLKFNFEQELEESRIREAKEIARNWFELRKAEQIPVENFWEKLLNAT